MSRFRLPSAGRAALMTLALLIVLTPALASPHTASAAPTTTTTDSLNLRSGPGVSYRVVAVMPAGVTVTVTGDATEGWYPLAYNGLAGWASGSYLSIGGAKASGGTRGAATVVTSWLNLRSGPGVRFGVISQLPYGTVVQITGDPQEVNGMTWFPVNAESYGRGYVAGDYLDAGAPAAGGATGAAAAAEPVSVAGPPARSGNTIVDIITDAAVKYGQSPAAMLAVARCESNLDPSAVNRYSGASGLFQFLPSTWRTTPFAGSSIFDAYANANAAAWMWSVGRRGEWNC